MSPTERIVEFLRCEGAAGLAHAGGRTLLDHLTGTAAILERWGQPPWLVNAALVHSVYGTDVYARRLLPVARRADVRAVAGERSERLAYLFSAVPRAVLFAGTHTWARSLPSAGEDAGASREELDCLVLLHMANLAEQARARDGGPAPWLVRVREQSELLLGSDAVQIPLFIAGLAAFSESDEADVVRAYRDGLVADRDDVARAERLALAAATSSVVAEPCAWLGYLALLRGDGGAAREWARRGLGRLAALGTAWDKRLTFEEWGEVFRGVAEAGVGSPGIGDPRELLEEIRRAGPSDPAAADRRGPPPFDPAAARARFHRYVDVLAETGRIAAGRVYPDLPSQPWHEPGAFPLAGYLESEFEAIREEILALEPAAFHRESERIRRSGDWDVAFLYERGRRHDDVCAACPVTTRGIETLSAMRTAGGLIYVSRMRAGTHIAAHRGPTNLRVRCHLGITVPDGDCAIRVGEETRRWAEGRCLVFDDFFDHEAWNHTAEDRIVLIVDLWHPGLSAAEVSLLEGLHTYLDAYARRLSRYWSANARAAASST